MDRFQEWINAAIALWGGPEQTAQKFGVDVGRVDCWSSGASRPSLKHQYAIAKSLGVSIEFVREKLDVPWSSWAEWFAPLILAHGEVRHFCLKMEIPETTINTWLTCGALPRLNKIAHLPKMLAAWNGGTVSEEEIRSQMIRQAVNATTWRYDRRQQTDQARIEKRNKARAKREILLKARAERVAAKEAQRQTKSKARKRAKSKAA